MANMNLIKITLHIFVLAHTVSEMLKIEMSDFENLGEGHRALIHHFQDINV